MRNGVTIGKVTQLEVLLPNGTKKKINLKNRWLAWEPATKNLHIVQIKKIVNKTIPPNIKNIHKKFHRAVPKKTAFVAEAPSPKNAKFIGLLKALVYEVPKNTIKSPTKNKYRWHHAFGDTGHKGGEYPPKYMPALLKTPSGEYIIKRRKGNIYKVDTWIRG